MRRLGTCCNCGEVVDEDAFCGCGPCRQAASVTLSPIIVPRQFKDAGGVVQTTMVQVYDGGTIPINQDSIGTIGAPTVCYYGEAFTEALDDTAYWGISTGTDPNGTCWSGENSFQNDHGYYFGANIRVYYTYNPTQRSYVTVIITPRFNAFNQGPPDFLWAKGAAVGVDNKFDFSFIIEQDFTYEGPYVECEGPSYATDATSCHGAATASLNYTDQRPSLCDCWSNRVGGGCQFDSTSPFSNMVLDMDGEPTRTQNAPSYWAFDNDGTFIVVPFDDGVDREFYPIKSTDPNGVGAGRIVSLGEDGNAGSFAFSLDACEGNVQGNGIDNPNSVFTVDITNGSDC